MWAWCVVRWRRWRHRDEVISGLIKANRAKPRAAMEAVDWETVERVGQARWQETVRAQRRKLPTVRSSVVRFPK